MSHQFFDSSPEVLGVKAGNPIGAQKYPWNDVPVGKSFIINDKSSIKFAVLRSLASKTGKKLGKRFRCYEHETCYEVACLKMTEEQAIQSSQNIVEALGKIKGNEE